MHRRAGRAVGDQAVDQATSASSPSVNAARTPGQERIGSPSFRQPRIASPLNDSATMPEIPSTRNTAPMLRAEPTPKFWPATITSPGAISSTQPGRLAEKQCGAISSAVRYWAKAGITRSVLMSSPKIHTRPRNVEGVGVAPGVDMTGQGSTGRRGCASARGTLRVRRDGWNSAPNETGTRGSAMGKLDGKVAYITGAARGQGRSHAVLLAEEGADIIGVDLCADIDTCNYRLASEEDLAETVLLVEKTGRRMVGVKADVRSQDQLRAALDEGLAEFGRVDIVLANAGISNYQAAPYTRSIESWDDTLDVCLTGVWNTLQVTVPPMIEADRGGAIVITASTAGTRVSTTNFDGGFDAYTAAKHGIIGLMRSYAGRLGRHNSA